MTEKENTPTGDRGLLARAGSLAATGGKVAVRGIRWLMPRAKSAATKTGAGLWKAGGGLAARIKAARSTPDAE